MYYQLHDHCKLVTGKARGAIYDFNSGKVYSINKAAVDLIEYFQQNQVLPILNEAAPTQMQFLDSLTKKNLGSLYLTKPIPLMNLTTVKPSLQLDFAWLELTSRCNSRCLHCYTSSTEKESNEKRVSPERWLSLISELGKTGCNALQFIGGEPLLYPHWRDLVKKASDEKFGLIEIFTNATLLNDEILDFLAAHQVHIATTLYAGSATIHDQVTQNKGSFEKTMQSIKKILAKQIPLRIASILMKTNEHEAENIMQLCKELGVTAAPPDVIRPTGRGDNQDLQPDTYQKPPIQPPFFTTAPEFQLAQFFHPCIAGKVAITTAGDVLPCIFARNFSYGNIINTPIAEILSQAKLKECWQTTKDKIKKCKDCEYRYACPDCRPLAQSQSLSQDWYAAPSDCSYDPLTGLW